MQLIQTVSVGAGGAANITFSSILGTYTDLVLIISARSGNPGDQWDGIKIQFNATGSTYTYKSVRGNGYNTSQSTTDVVIGYMTGNSAVSGIQGATRLTIANYAGSGLKTFIGDSASEGDFYSRMGIFSGKWDGTAAITTIALTSESGQNFLQYSSASLYGVLKGSGGASVA